MKQTIFFALTITIVILTGCAKQIQNTQTQNQPHENIKDEQIDNSTNKEPKTTVENISKEPESEEEIKEPVVNESQENESTPQIDSNTTKPKSMYEGRCKDSDVTDEFPDGINYGLKGNITVNGVYIKNGADYCNNVVQLAEWYCMQGIPRVQSYRCENQCSQGVCS